MFLKHCFLEMPLNLFPMRPFIILFIIATINSFAQEFTKAIEDNSYFIEEAYNQEDHVVQHISNATRSQNGRNSGECQ